MSRCCVMFEMGAMRKEMGVPDGKRDKFHNCQAKSAPSWNSP